MVSSPKHLMMDDGAAAQSSGENVTFRYDDTIVKLFVLATIFWGIVALVAGGFYSLQLMIPALGTLYDWSDRNRIEAVHINAALFAFLGNAIFAGVYYSTQRLCRARMWSDILSYAHFVGWQLVIACGGYTLLMNVMQRRLGAEWEWPIDFGLAIVWWGFFGVNFCATLVCRRERYLYVSLWFYLATFICVGILHVINNLVIPVWGGPQSFGSHPLWAGVQDAAMQWWHRRNLIEFLISVPFVGLLFYFVPKISGRPLASYRLAIVQFWLMIILYILSGPHALPYTGIPEWIVTLGVISGILLWFPAVAVVINGWQTLRWSPQRWMADPVASFFAIGLIFYALTITLRALGSFKHVQAWVQFTLLPSAVDHTAALGWSGMILFGMFYWMAPHIFRTRLFSETWVRAHLILSVAGCLLIVLPALWAGSVQSIQWNALDENGQLVYPDFLQTLKTISANYYLRALGGGIYLLGMLLCGANLMLTWLRQPQAVAPTVTAKRLSKQWQDPPEPVSSLTGVLEFAKTLDTWRHLEWHSRWERRPGRMAKWITIAVLAASGIQLLPLFIARGGVPIISKVRPYTPLELAGRELYLEHGCYQCHTQIVRPLMSDTIRFGAFSQGGEYDYDRPVAWGTQRIGPDLAREGGRQSNYWHYYHLIEPTKMTAGSIMPSFAELAENEIDFGKLSDNAMVLERFGVHYPSSREEIEKAARRQALEVTAALVQQGGPVLVQNKQIIAVIAYLQRLGTDITRPDNAGGAQ